MKIFNIISIILTIMFYAHASENIELVDISTFKTQYTYSFQDFASEGIKQITMNNIFAYALTKEGNVYRAKRSSTQKNFDFNAAKWKFINTEGAVSSIALYPTCDEEHLKDFIYARHSYLFKDRLFAYDSATKQSAFLTGHNRAIYKIGAVFDHASQKSCLLSASTFPSIQMYKEKEATFPLKNAYLLYAQEHQLVYAEVQHEKDAQGHKFERFVGTKFPYKIHIVWDTLKLNTLRLTQFAEPKAYQIKENEIDDLIASINNIKDLPLVAINNVQDKMQTAVVITPQQKELSITLNYHFDPEFKRNIINGLDPLDSDQQRATFLTNTLLKTPFDIKKAYYLSEPTSVLYRFRNYTHSIEQQRFGPLSAVYVTYAGQKILLDDVIKNTVLPEILILAYQNTVEGIFVNDLQNNSAKVRKFFINFKGKKILCTHFDQTTKILYCVTTDKKGNVVTETKDIMTEIIPHLTESEKKRVERQQHAKRTENAAKALGRYQEALKQRK